MKKAGTGVRRMHSHIHRGTGARTDRTQAGPFTIFHHHISWEVLIVLILGASWWMQYKIRLFNLNFVSKFFTWYPPKDRDCMQIAQMPSFLIQQHLLHNWQIAQINGWGNPILTGCCCFAGGKSYFGKEIKIDHLNRASSY